MCVRVFVFEDTLTTTPHLGDGGGGGPDETRGRSEKVTEVGCAPGNLESGPVPPSKPEVDVEVSTVRLENPVQ